MTGPRSLSDDDHALAAVVARLRRQRGVTQKDLASQIGVSPQQMQKYEQGINRISATRLAYMAKCLGTSIEEFHREEGRLQDQAPFAALSENALKLARRYDRLSRLQRESIETIINSFDPEGTKGDAD